MQNKMQLNKQKRSKEKKKLKNRLNLKAEKVEVVRVLARKEDEKPEIRRSKLFAGQLQLNIITVIKKIVDFIRILMYNIFEVVRMPMNSREMIRFLKRNGFTEIKGGKGSHRRFKNFDTGKVTEVPCHSKELGKILEKVILKEAGLK